MATATLSRTTSEPSPRRLEGDLVDGETQLVEPPDAGPDRVPVGGGQLGLHVELVPDRGVARADRLGRLDRVVGGALATLHRPEVGQAEGDVLDEDVEVVFALAVRQRRVDLARLRVDEERLDLVAVATEQRVRQRAVAPEHAGPMEVDEQPRHRVEQPIAIRPRPSGNRMSRRRYWIENSRYSVTRMAVSRSGAPASPTGVTAGSAFVRRWRSTANSVVGDPERLFLERVGPPAARQEPDEVARRSDGQLAEAHPGERPVLVRVPLGQRQLPGQVQQFRRSGAQAEAREAGWRRGGGRGRARSRGAVPRGVRVARRAPLAGRVRLGQSFLRR